MYYHASQDQGLKYLNPLKTQSTHRKRVIRYVFATDDKSYAAGFCFDWNSREGFRFGQEEEGQPWTIEIPRKYLPRLKKPCSIYHLPESGFRKVRGMWTPEFYNPNKVKIIKEEKYKTAKECLIENNIEIKIK